MCDPAYYHKIEKSDKVLDLATNDGVMHSILKYEVDKLREAWSNKDYLINVFSFADLVDK